MKKNENDMMTTKSKNRLSVYNSGVFDDGGREFVISCGYTHGGKFGYFVCKEMATDVTYEYTNQLAFYPKEDERTYPLILKKLNDLIAAATHEEV